MAPVQKKEGESAVAPLNTMAQEDLREGKAGIDLWLQKVTGGYLTVDRLATVAGAIPIVGNVIAAIDAIGDIIELIENKTATMITWFSLGVNLIGIVPGPGNAARVATRPVLKLVRQEVVKRGKMVLGDSLIELAISQIADSNVGELEKKIETLNGELKQVLEKAADKGKEICDGLATTLNDAADGTLFDTDESARKFKQNAAKMLVVERKPTKVNGNLWEMISAAAETVIEQVQDTYETGKAAAEYVGGKVGNAVVGVYTATPAIKKLMKNTAAQLTDLGSIMHSKISQLAGSSADATSIATLLNLILMALKQRKTRLKNQPVVGNTSSGKVKREQPRQTTEDKKKEAEAKGKAGCPKNGAATGTGCNIGFALGDETLIHTDFELSGSVPFVWTRLYNSRLSAYDQGNLGARWITPWTTRLDIDKEHLTYHAADGRNHIYPLLSSGQEHRDVIEGLTLKAYPNGLLTLSQGQDVQETYQYTETPKPHYRLAGIRWKGGATLGLRYDHAHAGMQHLSDLILKQGEKTLAHVGTKIDTDGHIRELWLIENGELVRQLASYVYLPTEDGAGDLVLAQDENGHHHTYEYRNHLVTRYADKSGRGMNLEWDGELPTAKAYREHADDSSFDVRLDWSSTIRRTTVTDALGHETLHYYDILGYTYRICHPDFNEEWFFRDERKNVVRHLHPDGTSDEYAWDEQDNLIQHVRPDGGIAYFEYDDKNNLTGIQDPEGGIWKREYDGKGNLTVEIDPLGNKTEYRYNKFNLPIEITDAKGGKKQLAYTEAGQLQSYTDCSGKTTGWDYDERGRLKSETNAAGEVTQYRYAGIATPDPEALDKEAEQKRTQWQRQNAGQLEAVIHPDQAKESFLHDAEGRLLTHIDPLGRLTEWRYTAAGLIGTRQDAMGQFIRYQWDRIGRLTALQNENGVTAEFKYDPVGKLLEEKSFDGKATEYRYLETNGILESIKEGNTEQKLEFSPIGNLTHRQSGFVKPNGTWQAESKEEYQWDRNGRLALAKNDATTLQWFYDKAGNLTTEHQQYAGTGTAVWHHQYDPLGNRIATLRPDGHRIERMTYGSGYVHGMLVDGEEVISFERDDLHRETERSFRNGLIHAQSYDPAGRLKEQVLQRGKQAGNAGSAGSTALSLSTPQLFKRAYAYDKAGQLTDIKDSGKGQRSYRYDPIGRLTEALSPLGKEKFAFDPASNLIDTQHQDIAREAQSGLALETEKYPQVSKLLDNLLRDYAGTHYRYDERGNLTEKIKNGEQTRYKWNSLNQLIEVDTHSTITRFRYDPLGRRIAKHSQPIVLRNRDAGSQYHRLETERISKEQDLGTTFYGWDGDTLAWETNNETSTHYLYEPDSFVPLAQGVQNHPMRLHPTTDWSNRDYRIKEDPLWTQVMEAEPFDKLGFYHCDHLGTPQEITDEEGNIAWSAQYRAWGEARELITRTATKAGFKNPLRFQGQYYDHETGLHYNRYRYYDPEIGRFISKDPIGWEGGLNLFRYASNPVQWIDPFGLSPRKNKHRPVSGKEEKSCPCDDPCPGQKKIRMRHFTNAKGMTGIRASGVILPKDQGKVFALKAKGKPPSPRDLENKYGIKTGKGNSYIEFDACPGEFVEEYNSLHNVYEYTHRGQVNLKGRNPTYRMNR